MKKKLIGLTKEHEALFNFVENNKHICTEKEKQKVPDHQIIFSSTHIFTVWERTTGKLVTSSLNISYFAPEFRCWTGWASQQRCRRSWTTSTLKSTWRVIRWDSSWKTHWKPATRWRTDFSQLPPAQRRLINKCLGFFLQITQELEKQRIEVLCDILNRYNLQMSSFGQTLKHVRHHWPAYKYTLNHSVCVTTNTRCIHTYFTCRAKGRSNRPSKEWTWKRIWEPWWNKIASQLKTPKLSFWWLIIMWVPELFSS